MALQAAHSNATGLGSRNTCWANRRQTHHGPHSARLSTCRLAHVLWAPPHRYLLASSGYLGSSRRLLPIRLLPLPLQVSITCRTTISLTRRACGTLESSAS